MTSRLTLVELLIILRAFRSLIQAAFPKALPNLDDPHDVFRWCRQAVQLAAQLARLTPTKIDDSVAAWLISNVLVSEDAFAPYYAVFRAILDALLRGDPDNAIAAQVIDSIPPAAIDQLLPAEAVATGAPIDRIILIVRLLRLLIEVFFAEPEST